MILKIVAGVLIVLNVLAFVLFGVDKAKAKAGAWRISESALILSAFFGGSLGALIGMHVFHHKTNKTEFKLGVPVLLMFHVGLIVMFWLIHSVWGFF